MAFTNDKPGWHLERSNWMDEPEEHDYPAAQEFLSLLMTDAEAAALVERLRNAPMTERKAKDILRASRLPILAVDNPHVADKIAKFRAGKKVSPVLVVRGRNASGVPALVADGYHRVCASYWLDENAQVPCKLV